MKKTYRIKYPRDIWIDRIRDRILKPALFPYAKMRIAELIKISSFYDLEVINILSHLTPYFDTEHLDLEFNLNEAFNEALSESSDQLQITRAKNYLSQLHTDCFVEILSTKFAADVLIYEMLADFQIDVANHLVEAKYPVNKHSMASVSNLRFQPPIVDLKFSDFDGNRSNFKENNELYLFLSNKESEPILKINHGILRIFNDGIALIDEQGQKPIKFFLTFKTLFSDDSMIHEIHSGILPEAKNVMINNLSIKDYCVYKILLTKYNIFISKKNLISMTVHQKRALHAYQHGINYHIVLDMKNIQNVYTKEIGSIENVASQIITPIFKTGAVIYSRENLAAKLK